MTTAEPTVHIYPDLAALSQAATDLFLHLAEETLGVPTLDSQATLLDAEADNDDRQFNVALSGGSTPKALFALLSVAPYAKSLDWSRIHLFWGDERPVPPDHPDSNYGMTAANLLHKVYIPETNVHRFMTEMGEPKEVAAAYNKELQQHFGSAPGEFPAFDLILLGMGPDGHTASLFPGTAALHNTSDLVVANYVEKLGVERLTFTAPLINAAHHVVFLVAGADKSAAVYEVLAGEPNSQLYPSQLIKPQAGDLTFMLDQAAAAQLKQS